MKLLLVITQENQKQIIINIIEIGKYNIISKISQLKKIQLYNKLKKKNYI